MRHPLPPLHSEAVCSYFLGGYVLSAPTGTTCPSLTIAELGGATWFATTPTAQLYDSAYPDTSDGWPQIVPPEPFTGACVYTFANVWTFSGWWGTPVRPIHLLDGGVLCNALSGHPEFRYTSAEYLFPENMVGRPEVDVTGTPLPWMPSTTTAPDGTIVKVEPGHVGSCGSCVESFSFCPLPPSVPSP
jgi:hypothetical protein